MKLLISNDDGIFATGIRTLANAMAAAGHQVSVVCPDRERSATGHGLTLHQPIRAEPVVGMFHSTIEAWACSGTPSDCVKLALGALLTDMPDMVLSGINHGANLGTDVLYSGTVSAAMEGLIEGIPAIAFSLASFGYHNFHPAAQFAVALVETLATSLDAPLLLNVNVPPVAATDIQGCAIARLSIRRYVDLFEKRVDPRGKTYYWLAGEVLEPVEHEEDGYQVLMDHLQGLPAFAHVPNIPADVIAIQQNLITLTPLQYNLTCPFGIQRLQTLQTDLKECWQSQQT
jgi:5'-nucleotidase